MNAGGVPKTCKSDGCLRQLTQNNAESDAENAELKFRDIPRKIPRHSARVVEDDHGERVSNT